MVARKNPNIDHMIVEDYNFQKKKVFKYLGILA